MRVDPFNPKVTLFELLNAIALKFCEVVPALTLTFVSDVAIDAVNVEALSPNETPFELLKANAEAKFDVVPAETLILPCVDATVTDAVTVPAFNPKLTLLLSEKVNALARFDVVPALTFTLPCVLATVTLAVNTDEFDSPKETLLLFEKTTVPEVAVCVPAAIPPGAMLCEKLAEAVIVDALRPNETLLLLLKTASVK